MLWLPARISKVDAKHKNLVLYSYTYKRGLSCNYSLAYIYVKKVFHNFHSLHVGYEWNKVK